MDYFGVTMENTLKERSFDQKRAKTNFGVTLDYFGDERGDFDPFTLTITSELRWKSHVEDTPFSLACLQLFHTPPRILLLANFLKYSIEY